MASPLSYSLAANFERRATSASGCSTNRANQSTIGEIRERFGDDIGAVSMSWLAVTDWQLGEVDRARELIETSKRRAIELEHVASMATPLFLNSCLEFLRGDAAAALRAAEAMEALARDQGMSRSSAPKANCCRRRRVAN